MLVIKVDRKARPTSEYEIVEVIETEPDGSIGDNDLKRLSDANVEFLERGEVQHNGKRAWFCLRKRG
jgi:hypothetical protein